jgi:hypothetical protein
MTGLFQQAPLSDLNLEFLDKFYKAPEVHEVALLAWSIACVNCSRDYPRDQLIRHVKILILDFLNHKYVTAIYVSCFPNVAR